MECRQDKEVQIPYAIQLYVMPELPTIMESTMVVSRESVLEMYIALILNVMTVTKKAVTGRREAAMYILGPVASGTVDTGEVVGVDWWSIVRHTATTQLVLSVVPPTFIYFI